MIRNQRHSTPDPWPDASAEQRWALHIPFVARNRAAAQVIADAVAGVLALMPQVDQREVTLSPEVQRAGH